MKPLDEAWKYATQLQPKGYFQCNFCRGNYNGGVYRLKYHLAQISGKGIAICSKVPDDIKNKMNALITAADVSASNKRSCSEAMSTPPSRGGIKRHFQQASGSSPSTTQAASGTGESSFQFVDRSGPGAQPTLDGMAAWNQEKHSAARTAIATFWYFSDIPFNVARSPYWKRMIDAVASCGAGFKAPTYDDLRGPLLRQSVEDIQGVLDSQRRVWSTKGCTIMSDGWTDGKGRTLINFLVASAAGTAFLKSVDASAQVKSAEMLAGLLEEVVLEIGEENVVQIITDNAAAYKAAGRILEQRFPSIFWTPCAAHCLDLLLEDIGKLPWVDEVVKRAKTITKFIYNHAWVLSLMRRFTNGKEIVRPGVTRFATNFVTLQSIYEARGSLKQMFVSDDWNSEAAAKYRTSSDGQNIYMYLFEDFWMAMDEAIKVSEPLVRVLRLVDGKQFPMGFIYEAMDRAKEAIAAFYEHNRAKYDAIWSIIDKRWTSQLHSPLHAAGYYLNPKFFYEPTFRADFEVKIGLQDCIDKVYFTSQELRKKTHAEIQDYKASVGRQFSSEQCKTAIEYMRPDLWWEDFGDWTPNLQHMAIRILSQPCSSSGCERNWSIFEHIHSKRRNKLTQEKLNDLVFVHYNLLLHQKSFEKTNIEPIDLTEIDPSSEWIVDAAQEEQVQQEPLFTMDELQNFETIAEEMTARAQEEALAREATAASTSTQARDTRAYVRTRGKGRQQ